MLLFQKTENVLNPLEKESLKIERDIQSLVEKRWVIVFLTRYASTTSGIEYD